MKKHNRISDEQLLIQFVELNVADGYLIEAVNRLKKCIREELIDYSVFEEKKEQVPEVLMSECVLCGICKEEAPTVFNLNVSGNYIDVVPIDDYPVHEVNEAIKYCPAKCIIWSELEEI